MAVQPEDFLRLAKELLSEDGEEIRYRAAISRVYYAAFSVAYSIVKEEPSIRNANKDSHSVVWQLFENDPYGKETVGALGNTLKSMRIRADYRLDQRISCFDAQIAVQNAETLTTELNRLK